MIDSWFLLGGKEQGIMFRSMDSGARSPGWNTLTCQLHGLGKNISAFCASVSLSLNWGCEGNNYLFLSYYDN